MKRSQSKTIRELRRKFNGLPLHIGRAIYSALGEHGAEPIRLLEKGDLKSLADLKVDHSREWDPCDFRDAYLCAELLSKYPFDIEGVDRTQAALDAFSASEVVCAETNARLCGYWDGKFYPGPDFRAVFTRARSLIAWCLGPMDFDSIEARAEFTSGASYGLRRRFGDAYHKFGSEQPTTTSQCGLLAEYVVRRIPLWHEQLCLAASSSGRDIFRFVPGNRITTVPKNSKTERTIAIEPEMNMFIQRGIGKEIRSKLRRCGVDLRSQVRNQDLAMIASWSGELATLDLKGASDSVSLGLVECLLPADWNTLLLLTRSPGGVLPSGELITYEKISSMGNGYTFELESLIFWALCQACIDVLKLADRRLAVYGDDLVVPVAAVELVTEVLTFAGFTVNEDKSFSTGPFRESCGKHYYAGVDVTPFYIRKDVDSIPRLVSMCNRIKEHSALRYGSYGLDARFRDVWDELYGLIPRAVRSTIAGPCNLGDAVLWTDWDSARPEKAPRGWSGWKVTSLKEVISPVPAGGNAYLLRCLSAMEQRPCGVEGSEGSSIPPWQGKIEVAYRLCKTVASRWDDLGPWLG